MRKEIHPAYKELRVRVGSDLFFTNSTVKAVEVLMDVDFREHPAWNRDKLNFVNKANKNISSFNKKFAGLSFGAKS